MNNTSKLIFGCTKTDYHTLNRASYASDEILKYVNFILSEAFPRLNDLIVFFFFFF